MRNFVWFLSKIYSAIELFLIPLNCILHCVCVFGYFKEYLIVQAKILDDGQNTLHLYCTTPPLSYCNPQCCIRLRRFFRSASPCECIRAHRTSTPFSTPERSGTDALFWPRPSKVDARLILGICDLHLRVEHICLLIDKRVERESRHIGHLRWWRRTLHEEGAAA